MEGLLFKGNACGIRKSGTFLSRAIESERWQSCHGITSPGYCSLAVSFQIFDFEVSEITWTKTSITLIGTSRGSKTILA